MSPEYLDVHGHLRRTDNDTPQNILSMDTIRNVKERLS